MSVNPLKQIQYLTEYAFLVPFLFLFDNIPYHRAERLMKAVARLWFNIDSRRRNIAIENILRSKITDDPDTAQTIAVSSFESFALTILESLRSNEILTEDHWQQSVDLKIPERSMSLIKESGKGVILASGHLGNWEIAAQILSFIKPVVGVTRPMKNPYVNTLMEKRKPRYRFRLTPKHDTDTLRMVNFVKNGEILALLADQHASSRGMIIDFFGTPASTHTSVAMLHLVTKAPIIFGYCARADSKRYVMTASDPLIYKPTGNREDDTKRILSDLTSRLETVIRQYPDQYLWAHRRWR